jgi:hypothetical protein
MKLKILLLTVFAAGLSASLAFAEDGKPKDKGPTCKPVHLVGTMAAPQSLAFTVTGSDPDGSVPAGPLTLAVGTTGQTVRVEVEACSDGTNLLVKRVGLQPMKPKPAGTTTGDDHHGDKPKPSSTTTTSGDGEHKGDTTTTSPTTTATTP